MVFGLEKKKSAFISNLSGLVPGEQQKKRYCDTQPSPCQQGRWWQGERSPGIQLILMTDIQK